MDTSFIQKLRMNSLFPAGNNQPQSGMQTYGMPDMNSGSSDAELANTMNVIRQQKRLQTADDDQFNTFKQTVANGQQMQMGSPGSASGAQRLFEIGKSMSGGGGAGQQQNVRFDDRSITPHEQARLDMDRAELQQRGQTAAGELGIRQQSANTDRFLAELKAKIDSGQATDQEKHQYAMEILNRQGQIESGQITQRDQGEMSRLNRKGEIDTGLTAQKGNIDSAQMQEQAKLASSLANQRGNIESSQILQKGAVDQKLQQSNPNQWNQKNAELGYKATRFLNSNPDVPRESIDVGPDGSPINAAPVGSALHDQINNALYGTPIPAPPTQGQNIGRMQTGPSSNAPRPMAPVSSHSSSAPNPYPAPSISRTPVSNPGKPTAADLIKKYGG